MYLPSFYRTVIHSSTKLRNSNLVWCVICKNFSAHCNNKITSLKSGLNFPAKRMEVDDKYLEKAREKLLRIYSAGVSSVLPEELVKQRLKLVDGNLVLDNGEVYPLTENVYIVGFGKAVAGMAYALEQMLGEKLKKCILSLPKRTATNFETNPELEGNFYVLSALFLKIENHISCM